MKKKEDVYVILDSRKKAIELEEVLKMFGEVTFNDDSIDQCLRIDGFLVFSEFYGSWLASSSRANRTQVSIQELKNILAAEYLRPGDEVEIIERLHDTLHDNHGYSLDSELLTKARKLVRKLRKPH